LQYRQASALVLGAFFVCSAFAQTTQSMSPNNTRISSGSAIYIAKCSACHSIDENRVGPLHTGVVGRKAGGVKNYEYSPALQSSTVIWNKTSLNLWLQDPEKLIPGQKMGYRLPLAQEREDVVVYLASLKADK
jgi:cytochrome c